MFRILSPPTFHRALAVLALATGPLLSPGVHVAPPKNADLRPFFEKWGLERRVQGKRPTCSVFTMAGAMEYAMVVRKGRCVRLSVEFLNWASNQSLGERKDGSFFSDLWRGYEVYGVCPERDMPYADKFDPEREPSDEARDKAGELKEVGFRMHWIKPWNRNTGLTEKQFLAIKRVLDDKWPVCGGFRWPRKPVKWIDGVLEMRPPEGVVDGHSVLIVGYRDDPGQPGGGVFIFRNSNNNGRDGFMTYEYARAYMNDAVWIDIEKNGEIPSSAPAPTPLKSMETGGASANHVYFVLAVLFKLGRKEEGDRILFPILRSFDECRLRLDPQRLHQREQELLRGPLPVVHDSLKEQLQSHKARIVGNGQRKDKRARWRDRSVQ